MKWKDLAKRVAVAVVGIPFILYMLMLGGWGIAVLIALISLGMTLEYYRLLKQKTIFVYFYPLILISVAGPVLFVLERGILFVTILYILTIIYFFLKFLQNQEGEPLPNLAFSILGLIYLNGFPLMLLPLREISPESEQGFYLVLAWIIAIWVCDTFAYFGGTLFGKHKLAPTISPNKSVEGFVFGLIGSLVVAFLAKNIVPYDISLAAWMGMGGIAGIFGQLGDLVESRFKRLIGVKDTSAILPGHGGFMDRFDSIIFTAPLMVLYWFLMFRVG